MFTMPRLAISLMMALQHGPVSTAIDASSFVFRFYKNGVIDIPTNQSFQINHAVLLTDTTKTKTVHIGSFKTVGARISTMDMLKLEYEMVMVFSYLIYTECIHCLNNYMTRPYKNNFMYVYH